MTLMYQSSNTFDPCCSDTLSRPLAALDQCLQTPRVRKFSTVPQLSLQLVDCSALTHPLRVFGRTQDSGDLCFADLAASHLHARMVCQAVYCNRFCRLCHHPPSTIALGMRIMLIEGSNAPRNEPSRLLASASIIFLGRLDRSHKFMHGFLNIP